MIAVNILGSAVVFMIEKLILHILNPKIWVFLKCFKENDVAQRKLHS